MSKDERIDLTQFEGTTRDEWLQNAWHIGPVLVAELNKCYEMLDLAESALTEIWARQIDGAGGFNVTEILQYYEKAHGLNIKPEASE